MLPDEIEYQGCPVKIEVKEGDEWRELGSVQDVKITRVAAPWCVVDGQEGDLKCLVCEDRVPVPMPIGTATLVGMMQGFQDDHAPCGDHWTPEDGDGS